VTFTPEGTCRVTGRSDATLNRGGVRLGSSDFYAAIEDIDDISDCLVVHLEDPDGGPGRLVLFVRPASAALPPETAAQIRQRLRRELSPRHVPDDIIAVSEIPKTPTGKKMEVPVKRAILEPAYGNPGDGLDEFRRLRLAGRPEPWRLPVCWSQVGTFKAECTESTELPPHRGRKPWSATTRPSAALVRAASSTSRVPMASLTGTGTGPSPRRPRRRRGRRP
jgi:hypothetical protein